MNDLEKLAEVTARMKGCHGEVEITAPRSIFTAYNPDTGYVTTRRFVVDESIRLYEALSEGDQNEQI